MYIYNVPDIRKDKCLYQIQFYLAKYAFGHLQSLLLCISFE